MTTTGGTTTKRTRSRSVTVLTVAALASLVLSPITAVWALLLGPLLLVTGMLVWWLRPQGRGMLLLSAGLGVILGVLPYFLLAALQA